MATGLQSALQITKGTELNFNPVSKDNKGGKPVTACISCLSSSLKCSDKYIQSISLANLK